VFLAVGFEAAAAIADDDDPLLMAMHLIVIFVVCCGYQANHLNILKYMSQFGNCMS
jgi:hypothetical protein